MTKQTGQSDISRTQAKSTPVDQKTQGKQDNIRQNVIHEQQQDR